MTLQTGELRIEGMDCADCALHVQERISGVRGVDQARVLLAAEKGIVTFEPDLTSLDDIKAQRWQPSLDSPPKPWSVISMRCFI